MSQTDLLGDPLQPKLSKGYAGTPGKGPAGETCGSCIYSGRQGGTAGRYYKCHHELARNSRSEATDIRLKTPACEHWLNY